MNRFNNANVQSFFKWVLSRNDDLLQVVFYFQSKINATSARYFPLFDANPEVRIVVLKGLKIPKTDRLFLVLYKILLRFFKFKFGKYLIFHNISYPVVVKSKVQVLHIDDPEYSNSERERILSWEDSVYKNGFQPVLVCTNQLSKKRFESFVSYCKILVIEQGFIESKNLRTIKKFSEFACVYTSSYIHYGRDRFANHSTWGAENLLSEIIPRINSMCDQIHFHLIGELGPYALKQVKRLRNVHSYGRVGFAENSNLLARCHLALYPREKDNYRSMLKIYSYIGAELPIVTFRLNDTKIVEDLNLGICVTSNDEFVDKLLLLFINHSYYTRLVQNIIAIKSQFSWAALANKLNRQINLFAENNF